MTTPVLLVTGGSRGIGAAVARAAAKAGYDVALSYVARADAAEAVARDVRASGRRALTISADMASEADIIAMFSAVDGFGPLSVLVYNAGVTGAHSVLADATTETIDHALAVNLRGALLSAREAVHRLSTARGGEGGSIVFVSSRASVYGSPGEFVWYAASKGGVDSLTVGLAREVAAEGVRVNAVAPGPIATEMHRPGRLEEGARKAAMGRAGTPDEVAAAILFLASEQSSYTTGAILSVAGGA
jgi:NAD(P)-dependent dehydrogenase (short-subunit alcohol dehydrogenase family)